MRLFYTVLFYVLLPLVLLRLLWRSRQQPAYRQRLRERFGFVPGQDARPVWLHAVSVGEVQAASPLIEALLREHPQVPLVISTTTPTGAGLVQRRFGDRVQHIYCPWDLPDAVLRTLARLRPRALLLMETELWPNLVHGCSRAACPVLLLNARLSERSARRYRLAAPLVRDMLGQLTHITCQSEADAGRFLALGAHKGRVSRAGNLKFEMHTDSAALSALRAQLPLPGRPVLVAGSTHPGEEAQVLEAFVQLRQDMPGCLLILAPRHPERAGAVEKDCQERGLRVQSRSAGGQLDDVVDVLLVDGVGELALLYGLADVAFVGGSLVARGGHNPLEPAILGVPVLCGPSRYNFAAASALLEDAGALKVVSDTREFTAAAATIMQDADLRDRMGSAGREAVQQQGGALERCLSLVNGLLAAR